MSRTTPVPSHPLSASTHVTPCSMAGYQALLLNLHGRSFSSLSPPTTHHCRNPPKIKSRPPPQPKPSQNQITTKTQKHTKSQIKSHPPKSKHKTHKHNQNHKMKILKVNPPLKKNIYWFCYYILEEELFCWINLRSKLIKHIPQARIIDWKQSKKNGIS